MKQKFKMSDLPLLIKKDRRFQFGLGLLVLVILWPLIDPSRTTQHQGLPRLQNSEAGVNLTAKDEAYGDIVTAFKSDLDNVSQRVKTIETSVDEQGQNLKEFENRTAEIFKKVLERVSEIDASGRGTGTNAGPVDLNDTVAQTGLESDALVPFGNDQTEVAPPEPPAPAKIAVIGAGDSVRLKLLTGVNAPTDGTPYPVVFKLASDVYGPDGSILPLGEARLIAAAQGSLTDSRALFRLTSLNLRLPDGRRKIIGVDGWVVGEDGIRGMSGILIDPIGKAIGGAGMTGALAGLGEAISASNTTSTVGYGGSTTIVDGNVGQFAAGKGLSGAAKTWSNIIQDRLDQLVPVVQVLSDREATAVFAKSVTIPDLIDALDDQDNSTAALD